MSMEKYGVETTESCGSIKQATELYQIGDPICPKCNSDIPPSILKTTKKCPHCGAKLSEELLKFRHEYCSSDSGN